MNAEPTDRPDRLIEMIRAVDPCPHEVAGPPAEIVTHRLHDGGSAGGPRPPRSWANLVVMTVPVAVAVAVAGVAVLLLNRAHPAGPGVAGRSGAVVRPCRSQLHVGVLPAWARSGFSDPRVPIDHALGRRGRIAAILFSSGDGLDSPPSTRHRNKILWISRVPARPGAPFRIHAQPMRGSRRVGAPVTRTVPGGPGPSIINLPTAGCWRLTLHWSGWSDELDLTYHHPR
jgi:hypothetical protein